MHFVPTNTRSMHPTLLMEALISSLHIAEEEYFLQKHNAITVINTLYMPIMNCTRAENLVSIILKRGDHQRGNTERRLLAVCLPGKKAASITMEDLPRCWM